MHIIDPLKESGLSDEELRVYRYLVALSLLSQRTSHNAQNANAARAFIESHKVGVCPGCERWYSLSIVRCPYHHLFLHAQNTEKVIQQVLEWEKFRRLYSENVHVKALTRVLTIKLYYYSYHEGER